MCLWHAFEVYASSTYLWLSAFVKGITSDNKLMNLCEIGLFHIVWGVSKSTRDNYNEISWKYCFGTKIYQYIWISWGSEGDVHGPPYIVLFIIKKKTEKVQELDLYLNQIQHHFDLNFFFLGWIIKNLQGPGCPTPISLWTEYSSFNWFHSNTPTSRHLFNTNC